MRLSLRVQQFVFTVIIGENAQIQNFGVLNLDLTYKCRDGNLIMAETSNFAILDF